MANGLGTIDPTSAGTLSLLYGGLGYGGFGRGYGAGGYVFGAPNANAVRINSANQRIGDQNAFTRDLLASSDEANRIAVAELGRSLADDVTRSEIGTGFANIANRDLQNTLMQSQAGISNERRQSDLFMDLNNKLEVMARDNAQCCCDLKVEGLQNTQKILDQMNANDRDAILRDLNRAERRNQTLQLEAFIGQNGGGGNNL